MSTEERAEKVRMIGEIARQLELLATDVNTKRQEIRSESEPELATAYNILNRTIGEAAGAASALTRDGQLAGV